MTRPVWLGPDTGEWDHARLHRVVLRDERLRATDKMVYWVIVDHANVTTGVAFPAIPTIAALVPCGVKAARRSVLRLQACRYLTIAPRPGQSAEFALLDPTVDKPGQQSIVWSGTPVRLDPTPVIFGPTPVQSDRGPLSKVTDEQEPGTRCEQEELGVPIDVLATDPVEDWAEPERWKTRLTMIKASVLGRE